MTSIKSFDAMCFNAALVCRCVSFVSYLGGKGAENVENKAVMKREKCGKQQQASR